MSDRINQGRDEADAGTFERMGEQLGGAAGRVVERGSEMAGGILGSMVDSLSSTLGQWWSSSDAERAARSFTASEDRTCRRHFDTHTASVDRDYDEVRPLYQFGYMARQNPGYRGRDFSELEPDLERAFTSDSKWGTTDWSDARTYVDFGFSGVNKDTPRDH